MNDQTLEALALIMKHEPRFQEAVREALSKNRSVALTLDTYEGNKGFVYACVWYALSCGVMITLCPRVLRSPLPQPGDLVNVALVSS